MEDDTQNPDETLALESDVASNQPIRPAPWARLVAVLGLHQNIEIWEDERIIGRADAEDNNRISKSHCRIHKDLSGQMFLRNLSGNGTLVNRVLLKRDEFTVLCQGDELALGPSASGYPLYIFQLLNKDDQEASHDRKRRCVGFDTDTFDTQLETKTRLKISESLDEFKCCICLNIWHDVVSVSPCLHNFCNSCFSEWYKNKGASRCKCPQCRQSVVYVMRNHTLCNLVENFLNDFPSLKRSPEDIAELNQISVVGNDTMKLDGGDSDNSGIEGSDDEHQQRDFDNCPQCSRPNVQEVDSGFHCGAQTVHLTCSACSALMPERLDLNVPQRCEGCHQVYCDLYWQSQNITGRNGVAIGCVRSGHLKRMNEQTISEIPRQTFRGNLHEQDITKRYISEHRLEIQAVIHDFLSKMDRGEIEKPRFYGNHHASFTSESHFCDQCADTLVQHLIYHFRLSVPKQELPPDAAGREDCWYGRLCRTQLHKVAHSQKFNHACEPNPQARQR